MSREESGLTRAPARVEELCAGKRDGRDTTENGWRRGERLSREMRCTVAKRRGGRGGWKGASPFSGTISSLASTKAF